MINNALCTKCSCRPTPEITIYTISPKFVCSTLVLNLKNLLPGTYTIEMAPFATYHALFVMSIRNHNNICLICNKAFLNAILVISYKNANLNIYIYLVTTYESGVDLLSICNIHIPIIHPSDISIKWSLLTYLLPHVHTIAPTDNSQFRAHHTQSSPSSIYYCKNPLQKPT